MPSSNSSVRDLLKDDEQYRKYRVIVKKAKEFPTSDYITEAIDIHNSRKTRVIIKDLSSAKITECVMSDQSNRSRIVQIRVEAMRVYNALSFATEAVKGHILSSYRKHVKGNTISERDSFIQQFIDAGLSEMARIESMMEVTEEIIADIDKTAYAFKNVIEAKAIHNKGEFSA